MMQADEAFASREPPAAKADTSGASFTLHGAGVSGGIAIGRAHLVTSARLEVDRYEIGVEQIDDELLRFDAAVEEVRGELVGLRASVPAAAPPEIDAFLDLHLMILADPSLSRVPRTHIQARRWNAEWALVHQMETLVAQFNDIEDAYLRERKNDVVQVVERVLKAMPGNAFRPLSPQEEDTIVVAHDLSPADMILFKKHRFAGFAADLGGVTSHSAIVARGLDIPAIVGLHHARDLIRENECVIIDGREGVLIVNPGARVLAEYQRRRELLEQGKRKLLALRSMPAATRDGMPVELLANIELPQDVELARERGATGVGLFRSEFLFLNRQDLPGEDEQFEAYRHVVQAMGGLPVTVRTLDLGADKTAGGASGGEGSIGPNPALGLRAIRYCLAEPQIFHTQLRAILRASHYGRIRLLIPMIAHAHEIAQTFAALARARASLDEEHIAHDRGMQLGGMVEIPAAALSLGHFLKKLDFVSIGTNDLIQYTLAIDRTDDQVAHLYDPLHPAVLQLIALTIRMAHKAGRSVSVCGEMAGDVAATRLLLGFGLREFSMHPAQLLAVKQQVLQTSVSEARAAAAKILRAQDPERRRRLVERLNTAASAQ
jgi:phosphotransferase system enzyme I (PtsI)